MGSILLYYRQRRSAYAFGSVAKSSFSGIDTIRGTILDPNNKNGICEEISSTEVRLKPNTDLKEDTVR